jgi:hypothetical protein
MLKDLLNLDLIKDKLESHYTKGKRHIITLKDSPLQKIEITSPTSREVQFSGWLDLSDLPNLWTKILKHALQDNTFTLSKIFVELLGLVSTLKWTGIFSKKPTFMSNPALNNMRKQVPALTIKNNLAFTLSHNSVLLEKIRSIKPDTIDIRLAFIPRVSQSDRDLRQARVEYMKDPNEIIWKINVGFHVSNSLKIKFTRRLALGLLEVMTLITEAVIEVSTQQIMLLS